MDSPATSPRSVPLWAGVLAGFAMGSVAGFGVGVAASRGARDFVADLVTGEQRADVARPATVDRPTFRFQHAGNWHVDVRDDDYEPDHMFSIDSPGSSFVMFSILNAELDPAHVLETNANLYTTKMLQGARREPFARWGRYEGAGVLLRGKHLGVSPGSVRLFVWREGGSTYTVVELSHDDDRAEVQPGFELVERTFEVKPAQPGSTAPE